MGNQSTKQLSYSEFQKDPDPNLGLVLCNGLTSQWTGNRGNLRFTAENKQGWEEF